MDMLQKTVPPSSLRIFGTVMDSIVDGPGLRFAIFTQGCPHACPGCHNPESHDPTSGTDVSIESLVLQIQKNPLLSGITLSGGEPMMQANECLALLHALPPAINVWLYTGFTFEYLSQYGSEAQKALLQKIDMLVDGPYVEAQRQLSLAFRGSTNQRIIDMQKTRAEGCIVLWARA